MCAGDVQPGQWVELRAKVKGLDPNGVDLGIELFSKTDQYTAFVRRDLCVKIERPSAPEPSTVGTLVWAVRGGNGVAYQRFIDGWRAPGNERRHSWAEVCEADDNRDPEILAP